MKHISHYVDIVMKSLSVGNGNMAVITNLLRREGCDQDEVRPCVYGACAYIVQNNLLTEEQTKGTDAPTFAREDVQGAFQKLCPDFTKEEIDKIYSIMVKKVWLIEKGNHVFCGTRMMPNQPLFL